MMQTGTSTINETFSFAILNITTKKIHLPVLRSVLGLNSRRAVDVDISAQVFRISVGGRGSFSCDRHGIYKSIIIAA